MSLRIVLTVFVAFFIIFSLLLISDEMINETFNKDLIIIDDKFFDPTSFKILLIGSSYVGNLDATFINEKIQPDFPNYTTYNLATYSDNPTRRLNDIPEIINLNPSLIVYGISFRDFIGINGDANPILSPSEFTRELFYDINPELNSINPKLNTLTAISNTFSVSGIFPMNQTRLNTPFYVPLENHQKILSEQELENYISSLPKSVPINLEGNKKLDSLKKFISEMQKNDIKIILFGAPIHEFFLETLDQTQKDRFEQLLKQISTEYQIPVYDLTRNYTNMTIWTDPQHVAVNEKSLIYSEDVSKFIIESLK